MTQHASEGPRCFAGLNAEQRAAAAHVAGPLLVIAGAGTGKTKTLAARVAALIEGGADPASILLLTFTRRAAGEMLRRAGQVVGEAAASRVWGGTFHAVAHRLLRSFGSHLGLGKNFVILDQGDAEDLLHLVRTDLGAAAAAARFPQKGTLLAIYSRCINTEVPLGRVLAEHFPWCLTGQDGIKQIFAEYGQRKAERQLVDYDDLLLFLDQALETPEVGAAIAEQFRHILVDEYQDTNPLQASILRKLWTVVQAAHPNGATPATACSLMVVGDDAQSIYSFRGATVDNILGFPAQFAGTQTVTLEQNYRSVTPILDAANAVMQAARHKYTKNLWSERTSQRKPLLVTCGTETEQSTYVVDRILELREEGVPLTRQAVLFRAGYTSDALEVELSRRNVPFVKWGGLKFLETAHVKDLLAFLRILENPKDDLSWMRVLQMLDGIGPSRARQAVDSLRTTQNPAAILANWPAPAAARGRVQELASLLTELTAADLPLPTQIERIRQFYGPIFAERYEHADMRLRDLDQLELLASQAASRADFLADLTLDPPTSTGDLAGPPLLDEEYVVLSTIHSAKGCEWHAVFLIHAADGVIPSDMANGPTELDEERRLLYVAMTRARDRLFITFPLRYYHRKHALGDSHSFAQLSRFLPPALFPLFERTSFAVRTPAADLDRSARPTSEAVRERVRRLWE